MLPQDLVEVTPEAYARALRRARDGEVFRLIGRAVSGGVVGDRLLVAVHPLVGRSLQVLVTAALGDARGAEGYEVLRAASQATGPGTSDLRASAVLAMERRAGVDSSSDLALAWSCSRDWATRAMALTGLAAVGDDRVYDEVLVWLRRRLAGTRRQAMGMPTDVVTGLVYLLRHLRADDARGLAALVRDRWERLEEEERDWVLEHWRQAAPGGPDDVVPPAGGALQGWLTADPLLAPLGWSGAWADETRDRASVTVQLDGEDRSVLEVTSSPGDEARVASLLAALSDPRAGTEGRDGPA